MTHGSLFSGIGGFDLAASWMGWENVFQVENDKFCTKVLEKNFPNTKRYGDIKEFDGTKYRGAIDVLSGGFPCQPFSVAGKRKGAKDDRFLWPEMRRVYQQIQPKIIVGENVTGIIGLALDQVLSEMEDDGYNTETYIIPACGTSAPHQRDRLWIIAHTSSGRVQADQARIIHNTKWNNSGTIWGQCQQPCRTQSISKIRPFTHTHSSRLPERIQPGQSCTQRQANPLPWRESSRTHSKNDRGEFPTQSPVCRGNDGIPNRVDRIKSLGNAIVPQVAFEIFKAIEATLT